MYYRYSGATLVKVLSQNNNSFSLWRSLFIEGELYVQIAWLLDLTIYILYKYVLTRTYLVFIMSSEISEIIVNSGKELRARGSEEF